MSNIGDGRDDENRSAEREAGEPAERVEAAEQVAPAERDASVEPVTDASPSASTHSDAEAPGDTAVLDEAVLQPGDGGAASADRDAEPAAMTTPPAEPGPTRPGDTAIIAPAVAPSARTPETVEPPVAERAADAPARTAAIPADPELPTGTQPEAAAQEAFDAPARPAAAADQPEPGAPVDVEPDDSRSRLDAAVQRANAVPVASEDERAEATPEPVPADSVRRETYVPPAAGAAAGAAGAATLAPPPHSPQTVYVQAPTPPKPKGNRGFGMLVALIGTVVFAALYAAVGYALSALGNGADALDQFLEFLRLPIFWVPIIGMFVGFALLIVIVNRGAWWKYAVFGLLVGVFVYFTYIGAALLTVNAWLYTPEQAIAFLNDRWLDPRAIAAGVIAREVPIWFGGWLAKRGRGVAERNRLAMEAYDRELAAGPRPVSR